MSAVSRSTGFWMVCLLAAASMAVSVAPAGAASAPRSEVRAVKATSWWAGVRSYDKTLLQLINTARARRGIPTVRMTPSLHSAATKWSTRMVTTSRFNHDPNLATSVGRSAKCSNFRAWGENIAYTSAGPASMFAMYMNSLGHRANILSRAYTHVGVATVPKRMHYGYSYWNTMKFVGGRCA